MINTINRLRRDELIEGSFILFVMIGIYNFFNYVFQISMARMLGPSDYGILAALMSLIYIFGIPSEAVQTIIAKYTSRFNAFGSQGKIKDLFFRSMKRGVMIALLLFLIFIPAIIFLSSFLKIQPILLLMVGFLIFYMFAVPISRGILQGKKKFLPLGINLVSESLAKVIFSILFVILGWKVYGAIGGVIAGSIVSFLLSLLMIKPTISVKREKEKFDGAYLASAPVIAAMISIVLLFSIDIILARAFFPPELAGQYAFVSLIAKVIIFASSSIGKAMFPISAEEVERGLESRSTFKKSLLLVIIVAVVFLSLYLFLPEEIVYILSLGSGQYQNASNILFILGISSSFIAFSNIIILYKLSTNKMKYSSYIFLIFVVLEVILLALFHSNLVEFSLSLLFVSTITLLYSLYLLNQ